MTPKQIKLFIFIPLFLLLALFLVLIGCIPIHYEPQEGVWYCEQLQIQLSYEEDAVTYITENGKRFLGVCETDRGSEWIGVTSLGDNSHYAGKELFLAKIISKNEDTLVLQKKDSNQKYTFYRID